MISLSNSIHKLTMQIVKDSLLNEEARRKEKGESSPSEAYVSQKPEGRGRSKIRTPHKNGKKVS